MAFDQNSLPLDLRPINVARVVSDEPPTRILQTTPANQVQPVLSSPNPNPNPVTYYPVAVPQSGGFNWYNPRGGPVGLPVGCNQQFVRCGSSANLVIQGTSPVIRNDSNEDLSPGKRLKFLCSFGGRILPRPGSGVLRYVGGHTRLIGFKGNVDFNNLARKMAEMCGQAVTIKYQLPGEDLDALVSIACQEDFDIMMEEYDKVINSLPDGSAKLRLYLFLASDADNSALAMLNGLNDNGQKYFEAVNGILDEAGVVVMRKESLDSAASTPSSDLGVNEAVDCSVQVGQGIVGLQSTGVSSPVGNSGGGASQESTPRAAATGPLSSNTAAASALRIGIPTVASNVQISNTELEPERSALPTIQQNMAFEPKQGVPTSPPYMRVCMPQPQDIKGPGDSSQLSSQLVYPRPSVVGNPGSVFQQQQLLQGAIGASPKQFGPAMSTPGTPQVVLRPNAVQQMINSSQVRQENYPEGVVYPVRVVPVDPGYCSYSTQVPHSMVGGAYGWNMSIPNRPVFREGLTTPQQALYTSNITKLDDCYMCQKSLPHAHSDSIAQQLKDGNDSPTSDSNRSYYSLRSEVGMQTQPSNLTLTTRGSGEVYDDQYPGMQSRALNQADNQAVKPLSPLGVPQKIDTRFENERIAPNTGNLDHTKLPVSQDVLLSGVRTPCSAPINNMVQQFPDISTQQYSAPTLFQAKQNALADIPMHNEILPIGREALQTLEPLSRESPKETSGKFPGALPQDEISDLSIDNRWQSNQSTEALRISTPENVIRNESGKFLGPLKNNMLEQKPQQKTGNPVLVDCINKANVVFESNLIKPTETLSYCSSRVPYNTSQPTECYALPFQPTTGYPNEKPPTIAAQKDDASQFQFTESFMSNGNAPPSGMPSKMVENAVQDSKAAKNEAAIKDPFDSAFLKNNDEVNIELWLEDAVRLPSTSMNPDSNIEHGKPGPASGEFVIQELQDVTEGAAALTLHASLPTLLSADLSSDGAKGLSFKEKQESGEQKNESESQDVTAKVPEKSNLGFPTSDLGRLQIINNIDLEELSELGSGTFGTVYHGKWRGTDVAIKRINDRCFQGKPSEQERMRDDFWNEAIKLADLHHPNVVAFYGVVLDGPGGSVATVTEYMINGSLRNALQRNERTLDKRKRVLIAMDVAFGMEYLHGKNIVHFDLKSDNLLVNLRDPHRPICKVGDLGLSKVKCHTLISGGVRGTLPWMAPELLNGSSSLVSEKVDVFSFGIVLWELITGEEPYADLHYGAIIGGIVSNTLRPSVPESCDPEWRMLMERCWSSDPSERPSFTAIANQLRAMASKIPPKGQK